MRQSSLLQKGPSFSVLHQRTSKECSSAEEAIRQIPAGSRVMVGGFGLCGIPENSLRALAQAGTANLTIISALGGTADGGVGLLLQQPSQVRRLIVSYVGENPHLINRYLSGQLEVELLPLGSLAEAIRAAAAGIPAFYTPAGIGTDIQKGGTPIRFNETGNGSVRTFSKPKEVRTFNDQPYILQESISAEYGLIKAWKADKAGNVIFRKTAKNFNEPMCKAAKKAIVEVEEIVEVGELDPGRVDVPAAYVYAFYRGEQWEKLVERKRVKGQDQSEKVRSEVEKSNLSRHRIAARAALELTSGMTVNLGIGIPVLVREYVPADIEVTFHSENGILGMGEYPATEEEVDADLTNAAKESITEVPGAAYLSADESFALIRGGHLQLTMLGAMQVRVYPTDESSMNLGKSPFSRYLSTVIWQIG